jgi:hypothetical protein
MLAQLLLVGGQGTGSAMIAIPHSQKNLLGLFSLVMMTLFTFHSEHSLAVQAWF